MSDSNFDFTSDDFVFDPAVAPARTFPWKWVIIVVSVLAGIGVLVGLFFWLGPNLLPVFPEKIVTSYYEALNTQDYETASSYLDQGLTGTGLQIVDYIKQQISNLAGEQLGTAINVKLEFIDMKYTRKEWKSDTAIVDVLGRVRIMETNSNLSITLPYSWSHNLTKRDGKWLIIP